MILGISNAAPIHRAAGNRAAARRGEKSCEKAVQVHEVRWMFHRAFGSHRTGAVIGAKKHVGVLKEERRAATVSGG
jgi:hypothetical protein